MCLVVTPEGYARFYRARLGKKPITAYKILYRNSADVVLTPFQRIPWQLNGLNVAAGRIPAVGTTELGEGVIHAFTTRRVAETMTRHNFGYGWDRYGYFVVPVYIRPKDLVAYGNFISDKGPVNHVAARKVYGTLKDCKKALSI